MNARDLLFSGWSFNPVVLFTIAAATLAYATLVGRRGRPGLFAGAAAALALALLSPINLLANGVLFTAHMVQHLLLLLIVPALALLCLPSFESARGALDPDGRPRVPAVAILGWILGVGAMWFWHVPSLCNAAASRTAVHSLQTVSLLAMGTAFWWPILSPRAQDRLVPGYGIAYLFSACLACSALGIMLTFTTAEVCSIFSAPLMVTGPWATLRDRVPFATDQQIGGLLMWLPMCLVYAAAIMLELARWMGEERGARVASRKGSA